MGLVDTWNDIRAFWSLQGNQKAEIEKQRFPERYGSPYGQFPVGQHGTFFDTYRRFTELHHNLYSRYIDYEQMDDYPELASALDMYADEATQADFLRNQRIWVEAPNINIAADLNFMLHKTIKVDDVIWELTRYMCIAQGELVWTNEGPVAIEDVEPGRHRVQTYVDGKLTEQPVKAKYNNGRRTVWKLKTKHREICVTPDHKMLVERPDGTREWVRADEIRLCREKPYSGRKTGNINPSKTDKLIISTSWIEPDELPTWENVVEGFDRGDLTLPEEIPVWFTRLMGFLWGDGFMGSEDLSSTSTAVYYSRGVYEEQNDYYDELLGRLGLNVIVEESQGRSTAHSIAFKKLLAGLQWKNGASNKRLPTWLAKMPRSHRKAFLDGFVDADGWVSKQTGRPQFHFEIGNVTLAYELKALIDGLGFRSGNVRTRKRKPGFEIKGKVVKTTQVSGILTWTEFEYDPGFMAENVISIEKWDDDVPVWDLEVDHPEHNFVTNGICVHNCKYGNNYERMFINENGVIGTEPLPAALTQIVDDEYGQLLGYLVSLTGDFALDPNQFRDMLRRNTAPSNNFKSFASRTTMIGFESWEVSHFKLKGKDRMTSYGYGIFEPARWLYRRLIMMEDAAVIHKLTRAPSRYVFYVDTGSLQPDRAMGHVQRVRDFYKRQRLVKPGTNKLDQAYNPLAIDEDLFIPVNRERGESVRVDTLQGPDYQSMEDVDYFRKKLGRAIKIPGFGRDDDVQNRPLSQEDFRFASAVMRVQRAVIQGYKKMCEIHLLATGRNPADFPFDIYMTVPSAIIELARIEVISAKADIMNSLSENVSIRWMLVNFFGFSEEEAVTLMVQRQEELDFYAAADLDRELERERISREINGLDEAQQKIVRDVEAKRDRSSKRRLRTGQKGITEAAYTNGRSDLSVAEFRHELNRRDRNLLRRLDDIKVGLSGIVQQSKANSHFNSQSRRNSWFNERLSK